MENILLHLSTNYLPIMYLLKYYLLTYLPTCLVVQIGLHAEGAYALTLGTYVPK